MAGAQSKPSRNSWQKSLATLANSLYVFKMGNGLQMIWTNTSSIEALVVKLETMWNLAVLAFVKEPVGHQQISLHPNASIPVSLGDRKNPASCGLVD